MPRRRPMHVVGRRGREMHEQPHVSCGIPETFSSGLYSTYKTCRTTRAIYIRLAQHRMFTSIQKLAVGSHLPKSKMTREAKTRT
jgi:hypothetical protein